MSLFIKRPSPLPADKSLFEQVHFTSDIDGFSHCIDVYSPSANLESYPLVIAPHPITWSAAEEYHGGYENYLLGYHAGWYGLADKYQVIIALPHGHHKRIESCSLASPEQITDISLIPQRLNSIGYPIDRHRIYICGKSMGGQEALVAAGCHPELFAAVVAFNPIVDLGKWQRDLDKTEVAEIRDLQLCKLVSLEVGGLPNEVPELYKERSVFNYCQDLSQVPCLLFWSEADLIVPNQMTHHSFCLYKTIKEISISSPISEYNHTTIHGQIDLDEKTRWQLHEWCDYEFALNWLLFHRK